MSLLQEIQTESIDESVSLAKTLRKCKVLAYKLGLDEFKQWVEYELNGYPNNDMLPSYRVFKCPSKGDFINIHMQYNGAEIPSARIPKEYRDAVEIVQFSESVAILQSLSAQNEGTLSRAWNANLTALIGSTIYRDMHCLRAWTEIPTTFVKDVLENVRNRVLTFSLETQEINPNADSIKSVSTEVKEKMQQIYNTTIHGDVQNFAQSSESVTQSAKLNKSENTALFDNLRELP